MQMSEKGHFLDGKFGFESTYQGLVQMDYRLWSWAEYLSSFLNFLGIPLTLNTHMSFRKQEYQYHFSIDQKINNFLGWTQWSRSFCLISQPMTDCSTQ